MMQLVQLLAAFALGALLMYGYVRLKGHENAEVKRLRAKLTAKSDELSAYQGDVQEHFVETAKAIDDLTRSYQGVFEQLERDAHRLVGEAHFRGALEERLALERSTPEVPKVEEVLDNPASAAQRPARPAVVAVTAPQDAQLKPDPAG
jgi:uncharacterized membrane-anchored protein YhcB (DUF1043 family)